MLTPENVILTLKVAVVAVTLLLLVSLAALLAGRKRLHGRLNTVFFFLTLTAVLGLEVIIRFVNPQLTAGFSDAARQALAVHLCFSVPAVLILPLMLYTGKRGRRQVHLTLSIFFSVLWVGTFVTGVFFLPHSFEG